MLTVDQFNQKKTNERETDKPKKKKLKPTSSRMKTGSCLSYIPELWKMMFVSFSISFHFIIKTSVDYVWLSSDKRWNRFNFNFFYSISLNIHFESIKMRQFSFIEKIQHSLFMYKKLLKKIPSGSNLTLLFNE